MSHPLHIGIAPLPSAAWSAGASYTRMLTYSLVQACLSAEADVSVMTPEGTVYRLPNGPSVNIVPVGRQKEQSFRGERKLRHLLRLPEQLPPLFSTARKQGVSTLLPIMDMPSVPTGVKTIGWIADFQHRYLPQLFSEAELADRDKSFSRIVENADCVMLSSEVVRKHFDEFAPKHAHKARVVPFPSLFAFETPSSDIEATLSQFHVPKKFALVVNQFWQHKNHLTVVEAIRQLRQGGITIPVIMTGMPSDYRDPRNKTVSDLLQAIAAAGLAGQVVILGQVDFNDLVSLIRSATVIIQPSLFEGWSTTVQDAKALGRPLICSDIPVHEEQAPHSLGFFPPQCPDRLADILRVHWDLLAAGPDKLAETVALENERKFALRHGQQLIQICREVCQL